MADDLTVELIEVQALSVELADALTTTMRGEQLGLTDDSLEIIIE